MSVKRIWRIQYWASWCLLILLLAGGGFQIATGSSTSGYIMIALGVVVEVISAFLMLSHYRCPKCGVPLTRRLLKGGAPVAGMVKCPKCEAMIHEE